MDTGNNPRSGRSRFPPFIALLVCLPILFTGCQTTPSQVAFDDMAKAVAERGGPEVKWMRNESEKATIEQTVGLWLRTNVTARSAASIALLNNRQLQASFEELGISQAELAQASRLHNPRLAASWRFPTGGAKTVNSDYGLSSDFLDLLLLPTRKRMARSRLEMTKQRIAHDILLFTEEVQKAFYQLVAQRQMAKRLAIIVEVNEAGFDLAQRQFDAGNINSFELKTQRLAYTQSRLDLAKVNAEAAALREKLNRLMGLWGANTAWDFEEDLPAVPEEALALNDIEAVAIGRRLDLAAARGEVEAWAKAVALKRHTRYIPGVSLGVDAEQDLDHSWVVGPTLDLEVPIFDQGQPGLARLEAEFRQSQRRLEALAVQIRSEVREARDALIAARDTARYYAEFLLPQYQQLLTETLLHYNAMQIGNFDLLAAKQREQQAEQGAIEALRDYWLARIRLQTVLGGVFPISTDTSTPKGSEAVPAENVPESHSSHDHKH